MAYILTPVYKTWDLNNSYDVKIAMDHLTTPFAVVSGFRKIMGGRREKSKISCKTGNVERSDRLDLASRQLITIVVEVEV